jgi:hypothetical protein
MDESTDALLSACDQAIQRAGRILKGDHRALSGYETLRDRALGLRSFGLVAALNETREVGAALIVALGGSWPSASLAARTVEDLENLVARRRILLAIRDSEAAQRNAQPSSPVELSRRLDPSDRKILKYLSKASAPRVTKDIAAGTHLKPRSIGKNLAWMAMARPPLVTNEPRIGYRITSEGMQILERKS